MTRIQRRRRAFTLVELVLSMAVMTVLMGGLALAMMIAARAVPDRSTPLGAALDSAYAADQLAGELFVANSFTVHSTTAVEFTVGDRNADRRGETIRYEWSGTPGASLTRKYNCDAPVNVATDVYEFNLTNSLSAVQPPSTLALNESNETLLISYNSPCASGDYAINNTQWIGQYFKPTLPAGATNWKVTRVKLATRVNVGNAGISRVQIQTANGSNLPSGTILEEQVMLESELSDSYLWKQFTFGNVSGLPPNTGLCLVVKWITDANACDIQYQTAGTVLTDTNLITTTNAGSSWSSTLNQSMLFEVYGTVTAPSAPTMPVLYYLTGVRIKLRAGNNDSARSETSVQVLNEPEVIGP